MIYGGTHLILTFLSSQLSVHSISTVMMADMSGHPTTMITPPRRTTTTPSTTFNSGHIPNHHLQYSSVKCSPHIRQTLPPWSNNHVPVHVFGTPGREWWLRRCARTGVQEYEWRGNHLHIGTATYVHTDIDKFLTLAFVLVLSILGIDFSDIHCHSSGLFLSITHHSLW